jgi:hypothetical protein
MADAASADLGHRRRREDCWEGEGEGDKAREVVEAALL